MSKQQPLQDKVCELMHLWGFELDQEELDGFVPEMLNLIINDMISKLQAEIKG